MQGGASSTKAACGAAHAAECRRSRGGVSSANRPVAGGIPRHGPTLAPERAERAEPRASVRTGVASRPMSRQNLWLASLLPFVAACEAIAPGRPPESAPAAVTAATAGAPDKAKPDQGGADEARQQQKELRQKRHELDYARVEQQTAAIDERVRQLAVAAELAKTGTALDAARTDLDVLLKDVKPRELAAHRISLDRSTYSAEHEKDELGELVAMYDADEFAKTTKELVLKRGRRGVEIAERELAVEQKEYAHFEQHELPQRERELRQKLADAELERQKAEAEADKAKLELDLAKQKLRDRMADLEEEIAELAKKVAAGKP